MILRAPICLVILPLLTSAILHAQGSKEDQEENPTRTLRIIVAGKRPMPSFVQRGDKIVEVDPPLSSLPPTSFSFTNPSHAPRSKSTTPKKTSYSAWSNQLIRIQSYKGPAILPLTLSRPLIESEGAGQQVSCNLGKAINPLVLLHAAPGNAGWKTPRAKVIDMTPEKVPARSVTLVNLSGIALKINLTKKGRVVAPNKHITLRLPKNADEAFRYKIEASNGKNNIKVSNSSYRLNKKSRLIIIALPGYKTKGSPFPRPSIRMITDPV